MKSNCLLFALRLWVTRGGYLVVRRSHHGWWPHFLWSPDLKSFVQFRPVKPNSDKLFPPLLFRGYVLIGDDER